ncbi:amino acid ABC transporter permease [Cupriavidus basilensis]|uniref:Amino acid ABC transporter permease n=1 Tax=Cupriavidus basilensis TaxID=68895 RepID=A0A643FLS0_9BURK|nr:amino acid ABC transporter permease [Cupriavidus basilensis]QOT80943.1 amino acid ABC transporter permease [Cupriavidus basilensis]
MEAAIAWWIDAAHRIGLNYAFLADAYDRASFVHGAWVTIELVLCTLAGSLVAGVGMAAALTSRNALLAGATRAFVEVTRNTPTLVQLYCAFLVLNMLITHALQDAQRTNPLTPFLWVVVVLSLHKGVFHAEALRAGIEAVPKVTLEAAASLGFDRRTLLWRVQLPLAVRFALPALVNNSVELVKATAVASAIAVGDITYASIMIWTQRDNVLELMVLLLLFFGLLTWVVSHAGNWLELRLRMPGYGER